MAGLLSKITSFARTPAGRRALRTATTKAQEIAKDPRTKSKVAEVRQRIRGGGRSAPVEPRSLDDEKGSRPDELPGRP